VAWEQRRLGLTSASALVVGNMLGAGVFTTSGFALADLGEPRWVLLAWAVGGAVALCGALSYGGIAHRIPRSGGEYTFLAEMVHPAAGFTAGWISLLAGFTAPIALAGLVFDAYLGSALETPLPARWAGSAAVVLAGVLHGVRLRGGVWSQNLSVGLKLLGVCAFATWGLARITAAPAVAAPAAPLDLGAFAVSLVWISFAYSGWNGAVYLASEIRQPERNLARSMWLSTLGVTLLYLALNAVFLYAAPASELAGRADIAAVAAAHLGGPWLKRGLALLVALALFTSISAMVMAGPRVYAQMARDGLFPSWLLRGDDTPSVAIAAQILLALVVLWMSELAQLLGYLGFTLGLCAAATVAAGVRLRLREGAAAVPITAFPWTPAVFIGFTLASAGFLIAREPGPAGLGALTAATALPLYALRRRQLSRVATGAPKR
jgi:APA family basic amino acid/polyamine antiporter